MPGEDINPSKSLLSKQHALPEKIGPYKIEGLLNRGGMSELYLGIHPESKDPITIKVLSKKFITNTEIIQHFLNEAEIISMTNHPNIVKMYGHGEWEGGLYIAMEYIEGISLRQYLLDTPISLKRALGIIIDIAYALCHLHTHGVIHRDLKPENILITETGSIKVIDFGIAQLLTEKVKSDQSRKPRLIGTPIYISPEQKENPETVSYPSDIYSLGIISYELILGRLSQGHLHLSLMPPGMQPILQKCLLPKPQDRYQDIVDFITDISSYLNSPAVDKDSGIADRLSEIQEELQQMQSLLIAPNSPDFEGFAIGTASYKNTLTSGVYQQFFPISQQSFGLIVGEVAATGAESFLKTALLKGLITGLMTLIKDPVSLTTELNRLLIKMNWGPVLNYNHLIFDKENKTITYTSSGIDTIWIIVNEQLTPLSGDEQNLVLGIDRTAAFHSKTHPWKTDEVLCVAIFPRLDAASHGQLISRFLHQYPQMPPQKLADHLIRKLRITYGNSLKKRPTTLICVKTKE
jgi:eukaryotic-like serine/threonine-protein kinase